MSEPIPLPHFQHSAEGYCLPACVRMVLSHLGLHAGEDEVGRWLGSHEYGTPSYAVLRLTRRDLQVTFKEWSVPQLLAALNEGIPVIAFVRTAFLDYWTEDVAHAVVVVGAIEHQQFSIHDPARADGPVWISWDGLLAAWAEFNYRGAAITK